MSTKTGPRVDLLVLADVASAAIVEHLTLTFIDGSVTSWNEMTARITTVAEAARAVAGIRYHAGLEPPDDLSALREVLSDYLQWAGDLASENEAEGNPEATVAFWRAEEARVAAVVAAMGWEASA